MLSAIALIVIGPKQLPELARFIGRMMNEFKRATGEFTSGVDSIKTKTRSYLEDTERHLKEVPDLVNKAKDETEKALQEPIKKDKDSETDKS